MINVTCSTVYIHVEACGQCQTSSFIDLHLLVICVFTYLFSEQGLTLQTRLASNSQGSLCLLRDRIKSVYHHNESTTFLNPELTDWLE